MKSFIGLMIVSVLGSIGTVLLNIPILHYFYGEVIGWVSMSIMLIWWNKNDYKKEGNK